MKPQIITANALVEGDVVYLAADNCWARRLQDAQVFDDPDVAQAALAAAHARDHEVVGVYLADVRLEGGLPQPTHFREAFRQTGPSNKFHGKQADVSL
ncbi:DUF2849 domain-containing protein (plasmid) [Pseudorhodobacter turbinis]|uniref:DUF2849 domain-containing protein n=1 Tax=Pseudorhodobacter turbinis TaxID=2500533 RepID=A0A4P8ELU0_9RHOB|nr:DUF2849 domain-containing protein [Pseudorhodobacter turbinis]QCO57785.1 DUF2849 domain-containing protein [Pseudorhodobacter turbinis]